MNKKKCHQSSSRFLAAQLIKQRREIFADGDWLNIQDELALSGWEENQRAQIHSSLRRGLPLSLAVRNAAVNIGSCPLSSRHFF